MGEEKAAEAAGKSAEAEAGTEAKRSYSEEEFKKLVSERDKAKERLRLIDEAAKKAEEEKLVTEGKAKELLAQKEAELSDLKAKATAYEEQERTLRESMTAKLTDEADKLVAPKLSVAELTKLVELRQQKQAGPYTGKGTAQADKPERLKLDLSRSANPGFDRIRDDLRKSGIAQ
jgi:hypothetical protein